MADSIDLLSFLRRMNMTQAELSKALKTTPGNVNRWAKREGVPSFGLCKELLKLGMTPLELFGEEIDELIKAYYLRGSETGIPGNFNNKDFREGVLLSNKSMTRDEIVAMVLEMKAKGEI